MQTTPAPPPVSATVTAPLAPTPTDKYRQAFGDVGKQVMNNLWTYMMMPENKEKLVTILDPLVQHIIKSVFPYIAFSAVLFVLLLVIAVLTFIVVLRSTNSWTSLPAVAAVAAVTATLSEPSKLPTIVSEILE